MHAFGDGLSEGDSHIQQLDLRHSVLMVAALSGPFETLRRNFRHPGGRPRVRGQARRCKDVIAANKEKRMLRVNNSMTRSGELFDISEVRYRY